MKNTNSYNSYALIDSGNGRKLERFGPYMLSRPCSQAVWKPLLSQAEWAKADAVFTRDGDNRWSTVGKLPDSWTISVSDVTFKISPTDFGHLGIFPEQRDFWIWIEKCVRAARKERGTVQVLNLFAYSGGSTLAAARGGAHVCHLDASKGMVSWARENAVLSGLEASPVRWIVDDVFKFVAREIKRGVRYDGIILDPPSFGRGSRGEVFKIEESLQNLLKDCAELLSDKPLFVLFSCHTPGFTPITMRHLISQMMDGHSGHIDVGEMVLEGSEHVLPLPSGVYARWVHG